jgi:hypothetical protein
VSRFDLSTPFAAKLLKGHPDRFMETPFVISWPKVSDMGVEQHNMASPFLQLVEYANERFLSHKEGLYDIGGPEPPLNSSPGVWMAVNSPPGPLRVKEQVYLMGALAGAL